MSESSCLACRVSAAPPSSPEQSASAKRSHEWLILAILSLLMAFASISTDLYLPALPAMAQSLHAEHGAVEFTISSYLIGFSLGQLVWGTVSDRFGRRLPVAIGLVLFIIGSAGCALSSTIGALITWRSIQAVGACASVVLSRAMVRDLYAGHRAAQMLSTLITVMAVAPLVGPSVGGFILTLTSWRAIFRVLVVVGAVTLLSLHFLPETLPQHRRREDRLGSALKAYVHLLRDRRLIAYAAAGAFFYAGVYAYIAGTPFAFMTYYHVSPQVYGILFAAGILGIMLTNQINGRLVMRHGSDALLRAGAIGAVVAAAWLVVDVSTGWGGLAGLVAPLFVFVAGNGFIVANSIGGALSVFPERAGAVSALTGAMQYGSGILSSGLVGLLADGTPRPMAWIIAVCAVGCIVSVRNLSREATRIPARATN